MCGWKGRRKGEGKGGVVDAGFVLPVAYLKNSSNTTSQPVRWHPCFATENSPDSSCRQARFSSLSLDACLSEHLGTRPVQVVAGRKKRNHNFFVSFFPIICLLFSLLFDQNTKTTFFDQKKEPNNDIFCHVFRPFFRSRGFFFLVIKRPLFRSKIFPLFSSKFSPFFIMVCGPHLFFQRRYRPTSYQVGRDLRKYTQTNLFLNFFRQTEKGAMHCVWPSGEIRALCTES